MHRVQVELEALGTGSSLPISLLHRFGDVKRHFVMLGPLLYLPPLVVDSEDGAMRFFVVRQFCFSWGSIPPVKECYCTDFEQLLHVGSGESGFQGSTP